MKNVGVLLSGCGYLDGAEIRESVLTLLCLEKEAAHHPFTITIMAPNRNQFHVVNHLDGSETNEVRNMMVEAARLARGKIQDTALVKPETLDALILPGGYGAAKNLSNFAFKGAQGEVLPEVAKMILNVHQRKKPIGAICIAPAVVGLLLGQKHVTLTVGNDRDVMKEIEKTGCRAEAKEVTDFVYDKDLNIFSTPAYMYDGATTYEVFQGIEKLVKGVVEAL